MAEPKGKGHLHRDHPRHIELRNPLRRGGGKRGIFQFHVQIVKAVFQIRPRVFQIPSILIHQAQHLLQPVIYIPGGHILHPGRTGELVAARIPFPQTGVGFIPILRCHRYNSGLDGIPDALRHDHQPHIFKHHAG